MSINTYAKITELPKSFKLTVHDADTGQPIWDTFKFTSLKQAITKFRQINRAGEIEYGLADIELKSDIVKEKKTKLEVLDPSIEGYI